MILILLILNQAPETLGQPVTFTILGVVLEKGTRKPLEGVQLLIEPTMEITTTDEKGGFKFDVEPGNYTIKAATIGYEMTKVKIKVKPGKSRVKIYLEPEFIPMLEVLVEEKRIKREEVSEITVRKEEAERVAGGGGDPIRAVQTLPGITPISELSALMVVRGSNIQDNIILSDKMFYIFPFHFGGFTSSINPDLIRSVEFSPGGFSARYGNAMGGILSVMTRRPREDRFGAKVEVGTVLSGTILESPVGRNFSFLAAGRKSYTELIPIGGEGEAIVPEFWDYQAKFSWNRGNHSVSLIAYGQQDGFKFQSEKRMRKDPELTGASFIFDAQFHSIGLRAVNIFGNLTLDSVFQTFVMERELGGPGNLRLDRKVEPNIKLWDEVEYKLGPLTLRGGAELSRAHWKVKGKFIGKPGRHERQWYGFTLEEKVSVDIDGISYAYACYTESELKAWRFKFIPGIRFEYFDAPLYESFWDPRFQMFFDVTKTTRLKGAWGFHHQFPKEDELSEGFGNPALKPQLAVHHVVGIEQKLPLETSIEIQGYYKDMGNLIVYDPEIKLSNAGKGYAWGVEVFLRKKLTRRFFSWLSYSFARSMRKDGPGKPWRRFSFDKPHVFNIVAGYQFARRWNISGRWLYSSGVLYTPVIGKMYHSDLDMFVPIYGKPNSERLSAQHRLDLRVEYIKPFDTWILKTFFEFWNAYLNKNYFAVEYSADYSKSSGVYVPAIFWFGLKAEF